MTLTGWFMTLALLWGAWRLLKKLLGPLWRDAAHRIEIGSVRDYVLQPEQNHWLALGHPMAFHALRFGMADRESLDVTPELRQHLAALTLHHFQLSGHLNDTQAQAEMPQQVRRLWFRKDLQQLLPQDDPRDAMAFAICRTACFVRAAHWLGWIDADLQWDVLRLNASRAQACFQSWEDYGAAYVRGRQQWINGGRSDTLGKAHTSAELQEWLQSDWHPWAVWDWRMPPIDSAAPAPSDALSQPADPAAAQASKAPAQPPNA